MTKEKKPNEQEVINAIDYIKGSSIFTNPRYEWITPLVIKTLEDDLCDADINDLVDSFLSKKKVKSEPVQPNQPESQTESDDEEEDVGIKKIKSIDKISNIGLLDVEEPIALKDELNVFYGKNGAGKSSIYLGLCKVLGKSKSICSNIATESDESCCEITIEGDDGSDYTLEWNSEDENEESRVMIFDSLISNYIVEHAQENQFRMAHLKMEYFSFLHSLYQKLESKLNQELTIINTEYEATGQVLAEKAPSVFEEDFDWDNKKIKKFDFTKKDEESLAELNRQIKVIEKEKIGDKIRIEYDKYDFLGMVQVYKNADLFILPSHYEGLPISILEAMASKVPVLCSNIRGTNEIVHHKDNGLLFPVKSPLKMARTVDYILKNERLQSLLVDNAYNLVKDQFNINKQVKKLEKLFFKLLNKEHD